MITHRALDGSWAVCPNPDACELLFHFPDHTPVELAVMPEGLLYPLLEAIDPPTVTRNGARRWLDAQGRLHRDYDLPARVYTNGVQEWCQANMYHRAADMPAVVFPGGQRQWWWHGELVAGQRRPGGSYALLSGVELLDEATQLVARLTVADALDRGTVGR